VTSGQFFTTRRVLTALRVAGNILIIIAVTTLPFARITEPAHHFSESFKVGPLTPLPLIICALSLGFTAQLTRRESNPFNVMNVILGGALVGFTVLVALAKISDANHVANTAMTFSNTYFGVGIKIALVGAGAIVAASVAGMNEAKKPTLGLSI
jgi:hypothetical protein